MGFRYATGRLYKPKVSGVTTLQFSPDADTLIGGVLGRNYGTAGYAPQSGKNLFRFILSSIPASSTCLTATLYLYHAVQSSFAAFTDTIYAIADANGDWIEGTKGNSLAGAGEPCWNAKEADGAGGVTTAWAGSAGMSTAGTDYVDTLLASVSGSRSDPVGTEYSFVFNSDGIALVQSWFGEATNNGIIQIQAGRSYIAFREHATVSYRPILEVTYS